MSVVNELPGTLSYFSSVKLNVWSGVKEGGDYEWWYFDALSDDGNEAIIVTFLDNYLYSPIYNQNCEGLRPEIIRENVAPVPAVAFVYYCDGKPVYRSVVPFDQSEFEASTDVSACRIGNNSFEYLAAPYGTGYAVKIDMPLSRGRKLRASFEWLSIESDLTPEHSITNEKLVWNLVAPRSDVTGRMTIVDRKGRRKKVKFRGTGYHDHNYFRLSEPTTIEDWFWGRAHFPLATAVFYRYRDIENDEHVSRVLLIRDRKIDAVDTGFVIDGGEERTRFGLSKPGDVTISGGGLELRVREQSVIESSLCYLRFLSEMTLKLDGDVDETAGISEYLSVAPVKNSLINRLLGHWHGRGEKPVLLG